MKQLAEVDEIVVVTPGLDRDRRRDSYTALAGAWRRAGLSVRVAWPPARSGQPRGLELRPRLVWRPAPGRFQSVPAPAADRAGGRKAAKGLVTTSLRVAKR